MSETARERQPGASVGIVIVTHGQLASELLHAAEAIVGDLPRVVAVSIGWHDDVRDAREEIGRAIARVQGTDGVLILTDMFGGTPSNLGLTFLEADRVEVITGVNLAMLLKLSRIGSTSTLLELARMISEQGRSAICVASDLLHRNEQATGAGDDSGESA